MNEYLPNPSPGRPAELAEGKRLNVYLDSATLEAANKLGEGNSSLGIRRAFEAIQPNTEILAIERIRAIHIFASSTDLMGYLINIAKKVKGGGETSDQAGRRQTSASLLEEFEIESPDVILDWIERPNYQIPASRNGFELFDSQYGGYFATQFKEIQEFLPTVGAKMFEQDGIWHIETHESNQFTNEYWYEAVDEWLGNSEKNLCEIKNTAREAWKDVCERNAINPVIQTPMTYWSVSEKLANELREHDEMVSEEPIAGHWIWGCLNRVTWSHHFAEVEVLKLLAEPGSKARKRLIG